MRSRRGGERLRPRRRRPVADPQEPAAGCARSRCASAQQLPLLFARRAARRGGGPVASIARWHAAAHRERRNRAGDGEVVAADPRDLLVCLPVDPAHLQALFLSGGIPYKPMTPFRFRHWRCRFLVGEGHRRRFARRHSRGPRPEGRDGQARSLHQRRSGHDEPVPARRGVRHRRTAPRPTWIWGTTSASCAPPPGATATSPPAASTSA